MTRLKDVPLSPAYLVFHDAYDNGAMDVYPQSSLAVATEQANQKQRRLEMEGQDDCGTWRAYEKLPRVRVYKLHPANIL